MLSSRALPHCLYVTSRCCRRSSVQLRLLVGLFAFLLLLAPTSIAEEPIHFEIDVAPSYVPGEEIPISVSLVNPTDESLFRGVDTALCALTEHHMSRHAVSESRVIWEYEYRPPDLPCPLALQHYSQEGHSTVLWFQGTIPTLSKDGCIEIAVGWQDFFATARTCPEPVITDSQAPGLDPIEGGASAEVEPAPSAVPNRPSSDQGPAWPSPWTVLMLLVPALLWRSWRSGLDQ